MQNNMHTYYSYKIIYYKLLYSTLINSSSSTLLYSHGIAYPRYPSMYCDLFCFVVLSSCRYNLEGRGRPCLSSLINTLYKCEKGSALGEGDQMHDLPVKFRWRHLFPAWPSREQYTQRDNGHEQLHLQGVCVCQRLSFIYYIGRQRRLGIIVIDKFGRGLAGHV